MPPIIINKKVIVSILLTLVMPCQADDVSQDTLNACLHPYFQCADKALTPNESTDCFDCVLDVLQYTLDNVNTLYTCDLISEDTCPKYAKCGDCSVCTDEMIQSLECLFFNYLDDCTFDCPDLNFKNPSSENKAAVIAGVVVAVVAVLGALARAAVWYIRSRKRRREEEGGDVQQNQTATSGSSPGAGTKPTAAATTTAPSYAPGAATAPAAYPPRNVYAADDGTRVSNLSEPAYNRTTASSPQQRPSAYNPNYGSHPVSPRQSGNYSPSRPHPQSGGRPRPSGAAAGTGPRSSGTGNKVIKKTTRTYGGPSGGAGAGPVGSSNSNKVVKKTTRRHHTDGHESIIVTEGNTTTTTRVHPNGNESIIIEEH